MMDSISSLNAVQVVSNFTRTTTAGDKTMVSHIRYIEDKGVTRVEVDTYTTYDKNAKTQQHTSTGSRVDITV